MNNAGWARFGLRPNFYCAKFRHEKLKGKLCNIYQSRNAPHILCWYYLKLGHLLWSQLPWHFSSFHINIYDPAKEWKRFSFYDPWSWIFCSTQFVWTHQVPLSFHEFSAAFITSAVVLLINLDSQAGHQLKSLQKLNWSEV